MELPDAQRQAVTEWLAAGASLSEVQRRLKSEFGLTMTYIDVRLLVLDIGAKVMDKPEPKPPKNMVPEAVANVPQEADPYADEFEDEGIPAPDGAPNTPPGPDEASAANVSLSIDRLVVPGAMISGTVTFTDNVKARWLIDQYGRFSLEPDKPGYNPSPSDLQAFQMQLRTELRRHGYA